MLDNISDSLYQNITKKKVEYFISWNCSLICIKTKFSLIKQKKEGIYYKDIDIFH